MSLLSVKTEAQGGDLVLPVRDTMGCLDLSLLSQGEG